MRPSPMTVQLGPLTVSNEELGARRWRLTDLAGWLNSTVRTNVTARPQSDGGFVPGRSYRGPKAMQLKGLVEAESAAAAIAECWPMVSAISPTGLDVPLVVTSLAGVQTMNVRVDGDVEVDPFGPTKARFRVPLIAWDARKYGPASSQTVGLGAAMAGQGLVFPLFNTAGLLEFGQARDGGAALVTNQGTAPTYPLFTITGGTMESGFEITDPESGARVRYVRTVAAGSTLVYDPATGRIVADGLNDYTDALPRADNLSVPGKSSRTFRFRALGPTTGAPTMTVTKRDASW